MGYLDWIRNLSERVAIPELSVKQPIIELTGDRRILIENHISVLQCGERRICVKVSYGCVRIEGSLLHLEKMSASQLIIYGRWESIALVRSKTYGSD